MSGGSGVCKKLRGGNLPAYLKNKYSKDVTAVGNNKI
jgi:hypothetical protein